MKLPQVLLFNVATVVVALVVYDQLRSDGSESAPNRSSSSRSGVADSIDVERRLQALEAARVASAGATESTERLFKRLAALEASETGDAPTDLLPAPDRTPEDAASENPDAATPMASADMPNEGEVRRFRKLQEAVRREESVVKNKVRIDGALNKLSINLTPAQRTKIHRANAAFEPRVVQIWGEVKTRAQETIAAGGQVDRGEIVGATTALIQQEFAATLAGIVNHPADADAIAAALMPRGK